MTQTIPPEDFSELVSYMKKLAGLVDPLKAIIDAEKRPDLAERIDRFLTEVSRIETHMQRAATAMEADRQDLRTVKEQLDAQSRTLEDINSQMQRILSLFGGPMDGPARTS